MAGMEQAEVDGVVRRAGELVAEHYVFEDVGAQVQDVLRSARGYPTGSVEALAAAVTRDLQSVNGDLHLRLRHHEEELPEVWDDVADRAERDAAAARSLGGVARLDRLDGNVAHLAIAPLLFPVQAVGPTLSAALQIVAGADALLLDLRDNRGGDPRTVALICGYLLDEDTHLVTMQQRDTGETFQSWSPAYVPGPRFGAAKPLYVLVGPTTFSGAEELAYDLQQLRPGSVVVGERTRGGAHPCEGYRLHPHLELTVPIARAVSAATGTNWEGAGVAPDVEVPAADALATAHRLALAAISSGRDGGRG
jgi:Peptidase family S41/N-terminal domain of Peptidase_S41 in eukaryotic IRBP